MEQSYLEQLANTASAKRGVLIHGPSGIGKTALLRWARSVLESFGLPTAFVRSPATGAVDSRFPLDSIVEQLASQDSSLSSLNESAGAIDLRIQRPFAVLVDDFDCLPTHNANALVDALSIVETNAIIVGSAGTPFPLSESLRASDIEWEQIPLRPLGEEALAQLIEEYLGEPPLPSLTRLISEATMGNPLYARESLGSLKRVGDLQRVGPFWGSRSPRCVTPSLHEIVRRKVDALNAHDLLVMQFLVVLGRETPIHQISTAIGSQETVVADCFDGLERLELVIPVSSRYPIAYSVAHQSVRDAIMSTMTTSATASMHSRAFDLLQSADSLNPRASSSELAFHASRSHLRNDRVRDVIRTAATEATAAGNNKLAAEWHSVLASEAVGDEYARERLFEGLATNNFDPEYALTIFESAMSQPLSSELRVQILEGKAEAQRRLGKYSKALETLEERLTLSETATWEVRHSVAVLRAILGDPIKAEIELQQLHRDASSGDQSAKALGHLGQIAFCSGSLRRGASLFQQSLNKAETVHYQRYLKTNLAWTQLLEGNWEVSEQTLADASASADDARDYWNLAGLVDSHAKLDAWRGNIANALDRCARALEIAERLANPAARLSAAQGLALTLCEAGSWREAIAAANRMEQLLIDILEPCELSFSLVSIGECHLGVGEIDEARKSLELARENINTARVWVEAVDRLEAQIELAAGNPLVAVAICRPWISAPGQIVFEHGRLLEVASHAYLASRDRDSARSTAQEALDIYNRLGAKLRSKNLETWMKQKLRGPGRPRMRLPGGLTEREHEVLRHIVTGRTNKDIARALTLSISTVNKHVEHIISKAGVARRTELFAYAQKLDEPDW